MTNEMRVKEISSEVTLQEIDQFIQVRKMIGQPVDYLTELKTVLVEVSEIEKRIKAGEKIPSEAKKNLRERFERAKADLMLEVAKGQLPVPVDETKDKIEQNQLTVDAHCKDLAVSSKKNMTFNSPIEEMLTDQFVTCHKLGMKIAGQIYDRDGLVGITDEEQRCLVNTVARLMEVSQKAALAINKLQTGGKQTVVVQHQNVQVNNGGKAVIANEINTKKRGGK